MLIKYSRVTQLLVYLGWVDFDLGYSTWDTQICFGRKKFGSMVEHP